MGRGLGQPKLNSDPAQATGDDAETSEAAEIIEGAQTEVRGRARGEGW